jgi:hypothetical protein
MKTVRWQIPFKEAKPASQNQKSYRIDIYDEGTYTNPIQLLAGTTPFTTEEDSNEDFFTPLRKQTGKIRICTKIEPQTAMPDGGMLNISDLLPSTNIARPVRLIDEGSNAIVWQGFLSCEVFSQPYIGIPDFIDVNVMSVLEAMDSVEVELSSDIAFRKVIAHIAYAMKTIEDKSGMTLFNNLYIGYRYINILLNYRFYSNVYFTIDEVVNGDDITAEIHSISCKAILERIAKFFGCCWREVGQDIYLQPMIRPSSYFAAIYYMSFADVVANYLTETSSTGVWQTRNLTLTNMSLLDWRGTNHQRSTSRGARRVTVNANLEDFELDMKMKECPMNNRVENPANLQSQWGEVYCHTNETFYNLAGHKHYVVQQRTYIDEYDGGTFKAAATVENDPFVAAIGYEDTIPWLGTSQNFLSRWNNMVFNQQADSTHYLATSYMGHMRLREDGEDKELMSGLMVCGIPRLLRVSDSTTITNQVFLDSQSPADIQYYVFKQDSGLNFRGAAGKIVFEIDIMAVCMAATSGYMCTLYKESFYSFAKNPSVRFAIRVGNYWVNDNGNGTYSFVDHFRTFGMVVDNNGNKKIEIPVSSLIMGQCSVYVYPVVGGTDPAWQRSALCAFITKMELSFNPDTELLDERSKNTYMADTGKEFKDEVSFDVDIATDANNAKRATMLWANETTPAKLLSLGGQNIRPEVDLLNRLVAYYSDPKLKLDLVVAHPNQQGANFDDLPCQVLSGLTDNKHYFPIAEKRDYRTDVCQLTCLELPPVQ